jgi:ferritin
MLNKKIESTLNKQIGIEAFASHKYLAMAAWCDVQGFEGAASFLYEHSDEERMHMMKFFRYINDKGGHAVVPEVAQPRLEFSSINELFEYAYESECQVSQAINEIAMQAMEERDHTTYNFIQWFINEQLEEEILYRGILDKMELIGEGTNSLFLIDQEIGRKSKGVGSMNTATDSNMAQ